VSIEKAKEAVHEALEKLAVEVDGAMDGIDKLRSDAIKEYQGQIIASLEKIPPAPSVFLFDDDGIHFADTIDDNIDYEDYFDLTKMIHYQGYVRWDQVKCGTDGLDDDAPAFAARLRRIADKIEASAP